MNILKMESRIIKKMLAILFCAVIVISNGVPLKANAQAKVQFTADVILSLSGIIDGNLLVAQNSEADSLNISGTTLTVGDIPAGSSFILKTAEHSNALKITPTGGILGLTFESANFSSGNITQWTLSASSGTTVAQIVGVPLANTWYNIKVDNVLFNSYESNASKEVIFTYNGGFSTKVFTIEEGVTPTPTPTSTPVPGGGGGGGYYPTPTPTPTLTPTPLPSNQIYPDFTLIKTADSFKVYVIIQGKKKWVSTPEVFETLGYKWATVVIVDTETLNSIPDYEDNLIRVKGDIKIWLVVNGLRHHIPNPAIFLDYGFKWNEVKDVSLDTVNKYQLARLARESGQPKIYYLSSQAIRKWIPTPEIFNSYNNKWSDIQVISKKEMDSYPISNLMRYNNNIYLIEGVIKKLIPNETILKRYDGSLILDSNKIEFDWYKLGSQVE